MAAEAASPGASRRRIRPGDVRVRTTTAAVLVVGVALVAASVLMVVAFERSLVEQVRTGAEARADDVAAALDARAALPVGDPEEEFIQVLDVSGGVVASSSNVTGSEALATPEPGTTERIDAVGFEDGAFLTVARAVDAPDGPRIVVVGRSLDDAGEAVGTVALLLAIGVPVLLAIVGAITWAMTGRALRPVEAIREEVEAIAAGALHRRVPEARSDDEIGRLAITMNRMLTHLERARNRERRLVADASHELRSPVASIRQHAEVALAHPDAMGAEELARVVLVEEERLQRLIEDLLLLARLDETAAPRRAEAVDVDDLVLAEVERLRGATRLTIDTTGIAAARIVGDPGQLERAIRNLTENAARHATTTVAVRLGEQGGAAILVVDDDGPGIAEADRERVFERFERLDDARDRRSGGAGLGLAIVREVVTAHGGTVHVGSGSLGGARLEVRLPLAR